MRKLHIAGATVNQTPLDWTGNLDHIIEAIREAKRRKIDLLCFPELSITAYGCEDLFLSKWLPEKAIELIPKIADECQGIVATVGLPIVINNETFNCVCVIGGLFARISDYLLYLGFCIGYWRGFAGSIVALYS